MNQRIVELRQYTMKPGGRDVLIELFEREFVEPQESEGMSVLGIFRDLDDPDRFVWLRGFASMAERHAGLTAFYGGPVWKRHRDAAVATMLDSDDVLLLRPSADDGGFVSSATPVSPAAMYVATALLFREPREQETAARVATALASAISRCGGGLAATFVSEHTPNDYPALPVREDANAVVWFQRFRDEREHAHFAGALERDDGWREARGELDRIVQAVEVRRLEPTRRSWLR